MGELTTEEEERLQELIAEAKDIIRTAKERGEA